MAICCATKFLVAIPCVWDWKMVVGGLVVSCRVIYLMFLLIFYGSESITLLLAVNCLSGIDNGITMPSATATMILVQPYLVGT